MNWLWFPRTGLQIIVSRCCFALSTRIVEPDFELNLECQGARVAYMSADLRPVMTRIELLFAERRALNEQGPHLKLFYRPGDDRSSYTGEEIWAIAVVFRGKEVCLPLGDSMRHFMEYLCRTRHFPQSARQIATGVAGKASGTGNDRTARKRVIGRKVRYKAVKTYIARARIALDYGFSELSIPLRSDQVLVSQCSVSNQVLYQIRVNVEAVRIRQVD